MNYSVWSQPSRRSFLTTTFASTLGLALSPRMKAIAAEGDSRKTAKACILVFLEGGPSHIDTFDPKPGAKTNGPFTAIDTSVAGVQFSEHFPRLAAQMEHLAVIRSLTSKEGDHERANTLLHTGYSPTQVLEYPNLGAVVAKEQGTADETAPPFVSFGGTSGAGYLGAEFSPHIVGDVANPAQHLNLPEGITEERLAARLKALEQFNARATGRLDRDRAAAYSRLTDRANKFRQSQALQPFKDEEVEEDLFVKYGRDVAGGTVARQFLLARRMIEQGVKFVEIRVTGWDTHADNFNQVQLLAAQLDPALAALIADLSDRGLLETTLVACLGEFGRTPQINGAQGRDHWSEAFSAVLAGGGVKGGQAIGSSDHEGAQVKNRPVTVPDLHASLFHAFGIDPAKQYRTPDNRPIKLTNGGHIVEELFG